MFDAGDTSDYANDDSAADLGLCSMIAFWTGPDMARIEAIFSASALGQRDKWRNRPDYRERTIQAAIAGRAEYFGAQPDARGRQIPPSTPPGPGLPRVVCDTDEHRVTTEVIGALSRTAGVYERAGVLVQVVGLGSGANEPRPRIVPHSAASLRDTISGAVELVSVRGSGESTPIHPPPWLAAAVLSRGEWPGVRRLEGLSASPVLRPDGSLAERAGYDAATGFLIDLAGPFPPIPEALTRDDAAEAALQLLDAFSEFPFASESDRSAFLALILSIAGRTAFDGPTPLFLIDANSAGAGKTLLAKAATLIATGEGPPISSYSRDREECRKQITTVAMAGDPVILFDNVEGVLGDPTLDRAITCETWRDRLLGSNSQVSQKIRTVWVATGNNVGVLGDTVRRTVPIRLEAMLERPEQRAGFRRPDLLAWLRSNRTRLFSSALTVLAPYIRAGKPNSSALRPLGGFEGWTELVRGAIVWSGLTDPCESRESLVARADPAKDQLFELHEAVAAYDPCGHGFQVSKLLAELYQGQAHANDDGRTHMRLALENFCDTPTGKAPSARHFGNRLRGVRKRVLNGRFLDTDPREKKSCGALWRLQRTREECPAHTRRGDSRADGHERGNQ